MTDTQKSIIIAGSKRYRAVDARLVQASDPKQQIDLSIYARRNSRPQAPPRDMSAENLKLPKDRKYLSEAEFDREYGANPDDLDKIAAWAKSCGLKVLDSSVATRCVKVRGSIGDINKAFGTELNDYDHPTLGRFRGREGDLRVSAALAGVVEGVFGLDTRKLGHSRRGFSHLSPVPVQARAATAHAGIANPFAGTFYPTDVADLYDYPANTDGSGQNIAVFAFNGGGQPDPRGGYSQAALETYFTRVLGGTTPAIANVVISGAGNDPGPDTKASSNQGDSTGEVMLDMCVVGSVAPGAKMFMYFTEFTSKGWVDALHAAITDNNHNSVISISYGNPESDPHSAWTAMGVKVVNTAMEAAAAKGITICVASGDNGSSDGVARPAVVDFPASSPNVLAVGGTKLVASSGTNPAIASEVVWNEDFRESATGGGVSAIFAKPDWQDGVNVPPASDPPHNIGRGVPDVAAVADPETGVTVMHVDGQRLVAIGGTSAAAPLWAALIARLNQGLNARCGNLNPVLYTKFPTGVLRDITQGNNGAYNAGRGWDACTGLGAPGGSALLAALSGRGSGTTRAKRAQATATRRPAAKKRKAPRR